MEKYVTPRIYICILKMGSKPVFHMGGSLSLPKSMESLSLTWKGMNEEPVNKGNLLSLFYRNFVVPVLHH